MSLSPAQIASLAFAAFVLVVMVGVVLPAVWSTRRSRRAAAILVLGRLVTLVRPLPWNEGRSAASEGAPPVTGE